MDIKVEYVSVSDLKTSEYNPRKATEKEINNLKESIKRFGLVDPIIVNSAENRKNVVIGGHFRLKVAKELGYEVVPVVYVNIPDPEKEKELNLRLNKNLGEWDLDLLANFSENLLSDVGFESEELDKIFEIDDGEIEEFNLENETKKIIKEPRGVKEGDLWQLGEHRLYVGDCTIKDSWERVLQGEKIDMIFTDPPYGINLDTDFSDMKGIGRGKKYIKIKGDEKSFDPKFIFDFAPHCKEIFLWGADYYAEKLPNRNKGSLFVWDKTGGGISPNSNYEKQFGSNFELCWSKTRHKRQIVRCLWKGIFGLSKEDTRRRVHPTQKPVELCKWFVEKFSKRNQIIFDCFGGSGSTLIACEITKRKCRLIEIDPFYAEVILNRWEQFTGQKAEKIN